MMCWDCHAEAVKLPAGVLNVVTGLGGDAGAPLSGHPGVNKISFTGSMETGRRVNLAAAANLRPTSMVQHDHCLLLYSLPSAPGVCNAAPVSCEQATRPCQSKHQDRLALALQELGGKSALIVCADADVERAVDLAIGGAFFNAGQMCSATSRILIAQPIYDLFARRFVERAAALRLDDQGDEKAELGPLISETQRNRVMSHVEAGRREARVLLDAKVPERDGYFMTPAVFGDVPLDAPIWREEIFGPVACLRSFSEDDEAISLANDSEYGLVATVVTRDARRADAFARDLQVGMVWVNAPQIIFPQTGWGGFRQSGLGRELGPWGLRAYQEIRHVVTMA